MEEAWPVHWLVEEQVITWTEAHTLMNIVDIDMQAHVHEAKLAAKYRAEKRK